MPQNFEPVGDILQGWREAKKDMLNEALSNEAINEITEPLQVTKRPKLMKANEDALGTSPQSRAAVAYDYLDAKAFWDSVGKSCFACGAIGLQHARQPNLCPNLIAWAGYVKDYRKTPSSPEYCPYCLQKGHNYKAQRFGELIGQWRNACESGKKSWDDLLSSNMGKCVIAFRKCPPATYAARGHEQFCDSCWLYHSQGRDGCLVPEFAVRNVLQTVWYDLRLREKLQAQQWVQGKNWQSWGDFMQWALYYRSDQDITNLDRIACFLQRDKRTGPQKT